MSIIYINGKFFKEKDAVISVLDHGLLYGDGIFETMRAYNGHLFRPQDHWERFQQAATTLGFNIPVSSQKLFEAISHSLKINRLKNAYVRVTLTRGKGKPGLDPKLCKKNNLIIYVNKSHIYPSYIYKRGIETVILKNPTLPLSLLNKIKSLNYLTHIFAKMELKNKNCEEGIMLNPRGFIAGGTVSNIFLIKNNSLFTPPVSDSVLNGITRQVVMEIAKKSNLRVQELNFKKDLFFEADEAFFTNTGFEILPIREIDKIKIGDVCPGPITKLIRKEFERQKKTERQIYCPSVKEN